jgi:hypothetical protein
MSIQKTLDSLQPYVIGIRYLDGRVVVDVVFKEGWTVLEDPTIKKVKGDEGLNYYMVFSDLDNIGLDELLVYVNKTIKLNLEREKKHDLLRTKVNELKEIFKKNSLDKLNRLNFSFGEEELLPNINDFDFEEETHKPSEKEFVEEEIIDESGETTIDTPFLDENGVPIAVTDEEKELIEEESRGERNRKKIMELKKQSSLIDKTSKKIELPPKRKVSKIANDVGHYTDCGCGPSDACHKCIDTKEY